MLFWLLGVKICIFQGLGFGCFGVLMWCGWLMIMWDMFSRLNMVFIGVLFSSYVLFVCLWVMCFWNLRVWVVVMGGMLCWVWFVLCWLYSLMVFWLESGMMVQGMIVDGLKVFMVGFFGREFSLLGLVVVECY